MSFRMAQCTLALIFAATVGAGPLSQDLRRPVVRVVMTWEQPASGMFIKHLHREVEQIFRPSGLNLRWEHGRQTTQEIYDGSMVVEMRGRCSAARVRDFPPGSGMNKVRLGWTIVSAGEVIRHSVVDCDQLARAVSEARSRMFHPSPVYSLFTRLAARVLAHEMLHALLGRDHETAGLSRPSLLVEELEISTMKLRPEQIAALRRIRKDRLGPQ